MLLRKRALRSSAVLGAGQVLAYGSSFVRNMILARMLTKADFGIAASFSLVILLLEFSSKLGIARFVIREEEGGKPEFIASAHLMQCVSGGLSALLIALLAWPLAGLLGLVDLRWAFVILAIIPALNAVQHLDIRRYERELRFGPSTLVDVVPQLVITAAAWPAAAWLGDYRAMLLLLVAKSLSSCSLSHLLAEQPYRWNYSRVYTGRMIRFGWPLVVTGFLMFGALHGDQFLIATYYTMDVLGPFAAAAALATAPIYFFGHVFNSIMLPVMARIQNDGEAFRQRFEQAIAVISAVGAVCAVGMIIGSEAVMLLIYGPKYAGSGVILVWLSIASALRSTRVASSIAATAKGDSKNHMVANIWRVVGLLPALVLAIAQQPVWMIAATGVIGEGLACRASFVRLRRRDGVPLSIGLIPLGWVSLVTTLAAFLSIIIRDCNLNLMIIIAACGSAVVGLLFVLVSPVLRSEASRCLVHCRKRGWWNLSKSV